MHPSKQYILVLDTEGLVHIFNIADGMIRGRIQVGKGCKQITTDSSGLYFAVLTPIQTVLMLEVGTGRKIYEFCPQLKRVGHFMFSADTKAFLIFNKEAISVKRYEIDPRLSNLSENVLLGMSRDPNFWSKFPINLE